MLPWFNNLAYYGNAWFPVLIAGTPGIFIPKWGPLRFQLFTRVVLVQPFSPRAMASTLNVYRYLKGMELAFGVFSLVFRDDIFSSRRFNWFYLFVAGLPPAARWLSVLLDGKPDPTYIWIGAIENLSCIIVFAYSRQMVKQP